MPCMGVVSERKAVHDVVVFSCLGGQFLIPIALFGRVDGKGKSRGVCCVTVCCCHALCPVVLPEHGLGDCVVAFFFPSA
jgi:hypothetical protein